MSKRILVGSIFVTSAFIDAPGALSVGSVSLMGAMTALYAVAIAYLLARHPRGSCRALLRIWPLSTLFLFSLAQLFWDHASVQAIQTLCMQWIFIGLIALMMTGETEDLDESAVGRMLQNAALFACAFYLVTFLLAGSGDETLASASVVAARSFGLLGLLAVAWFLSRWSAGSRADFWLAIATIALIALSLSRTALVIGVLLFPLARLRTVSLRDLKRLAIGAGIAILALYSLIVSVDALRTRFLGTNSLDDYISGDAWVDTNGRLTAWAITIGSYAESPWFGKGPGSANDLISDVLYGYKLDHPHNEYLRFLHDEGLLGFVLLLLGCGQLLILCRRAYRKRLDGDGNASIQLAASLSLVGVLLSILTDNTASYIFVMGPLGILVGMSLRSLKESGPEKSVATDISISPAAIGPAEFQP